MQGDLKKDIRIPEKEAIIRKIITTVRSTIDLDEMLTIICDEVGKAFDVDRASICQFPDKNDRSFFIPKREYKKNKSVKSIEEIKQLDIKYIKGIGDFWGENTITTGKVVFVNDINNCEDDCFKKIYSLLKVKSIIGIPIKKDDDRWGGLFLSNTKKFNRWTDEDIELLEIISDQIYIAIKQAELYSSVKKQFEKEILLRKIIQTIRSSIEIKETLKTIVTEIGKAFKADRIFLVEFDPETNTPLVLAKHSEYLASSDQVSCVGFNFAGQEVEFFTDIHKQTKPVIVSDVEKYIKENDLKDKLEGQWLLNINLKTGIAVPIFYGNKVYGVLCIHYTQDIAPTTDEQIDFIGTLGDQMGIALYQAKLYKKVQETAKKEKMLAEIMAIIKSNLKLDEVLLMICSILKQFFDVNKIIITKLDTEEKKLVLLKKSHKKNKDDFSLKSNKYFYEKILKNKNLIINDIEKADNPVYFLKELEANNIKALIMVPILINENKVGAIIIQDNKKNNWQQEDVDFLSRITDYISIAIKESNFYNQSEFISNAAHELKTPLSIINGYANALLNLEKPDCETTNKFLKTIKNNTERLNKLIDNLLFISTIEKKLDNEKWSFEELQVVDLIENSIQLCDEKIKAKNIKIEKKMENIVIKKANIILLQQLMINLITNAVNYSEAYSTVSLKAIKKDKEVLISIKDNGCGIKKEHISNIFERFYRADKSRSRETGGTGLGLSISKLISEIHDGYITVESVFGKESVFTLHLPE